MPLYEYECKSCHQVVEKLVRGDSATLADDEAGCPSCGDTSLERLLSLPAVPALGSRLPVTGPAESCDMPRCCGGGCQIPDA